jgi:hypothetical protein
MIYKVDLREPNSPNSVWCTVHVKAKSLSDAITKAEKLGSKLHGMPLIVCGICETLIQLVG